MREHSRPGLLFFFQPEDGIRDLYVTGVQTCALPISRPAANTRALAAATGPAARTAPDGPRAYLPRRGAAARGRRKALTAAAALGRAAIEVVDEEIGRAACRERV